MPLWPSIRNRNSYLRVTLEQVGLNILAIQVYILFTSPQPNSHA